MPIWTFDLPDDAQPNLVLDLSLSLDHKSRRQLYSV